MGQLAQLCGTKDAKDGYVAQLGEIKERYKMISQSKGWELVSDGKEISTYTLKLEGHPNNAIKGVINTNLKFSPKKFIRFISSTQRHKFKDDSILSLFEPRATMFNSVYRKEKVDVHHMSYKIEKLKDEEYLTVQSFVDDSADERSFIYGGSLSKDSKRTMKTLGVASIEGSDCVLGSIEMFSIECKKLSGGIIRMEYIIHLGRTQNVHFLSVYENFCLEKVKSLASYFDVFVKNEKPKLDRVENEKKKLKEKELETIDSIKKDTHYLELLKKKQKQLDFESNKSPGNTPKKNGKGVKVKRISKKLLEKQKKEEEEILESLRQSELEKAEKEKERLRLENDEKEREKKKQAEAEKKRKEELERVEAEKKKKEEEEKQKKFLEKQKRERRQRLIRERRRKREKEERIKGKKKIPVLIITCAFNIFIYDITKDKVLHEIKIRESDTICSSLLLNEDYLVTGGGEDDGKIRFYEMGEKGISLKEEFQGHKGQIWKMIKLPSGKVATGGEDCTVKIWDLENKKVLHTLTHELDVLTVNQISDNIFASAGLDRKIRLWDVYTFENVATIFHDKIDIGDIWCLGMLKNNRLLLSSGGKGVFHFWDVKNKKPLGTFEDAHKKCCFCFLKMNEEKFITSSFDNEIKVWEFNKRKELVVKNTMNEHKFPVFVLKKYKMDGKRFTLVSGDVGGVIKFWDSRNFKCIKTIKLPGKKAAPKIRDLYFLETNVY